MPQIKNDRLLKAIWREPVDTTPIWVMRQAGRYLPEYRTTRARAGSFMTLCKTPELACEVTLQPLERYDFDASIIFSDILTIPDAMGLGLGFTEGSGPYFERPVQTEKEINQLTVPDLAKLEYVYDAIKLVTQELDGKIPLIGFCGSPYTLAAYMVEGRSKNGFPKLLKMLDEDPKTLHKLLDTLAKSVVAHLNQQIKAGVSVVMIFDTWGGMLDTKNYREFSLAYLKQITSQLLRTYNNSRIPVILFTKSGHQWLTEMADAGADVLGVDWQISLNEAREQVGNKVALQGNMNPEVLLTNPQVIQDEVKKIIESYGKGSGHIFNLGHGITPNVPPEHVKILVDAVHEMGKHFNQR